jgi:hypothetical protein
VSDSDLNAINTIDTDMVDNIKIDRLPLGPGADHENDIPYPLARAISCQLIRTTALGQSVYPDIALYIRNDYISIVDSKKDDTGFIISNNIGHALYN